VPEASHRVAQSTPGAVRLPISAQTLRHRLREQGLLATVDNERQMLLVRRVLDGSSGQVLHLRSNVW
jgi:hypothetical protein